MKTVPLLYFPSSQKDVRNVEGFADCVGDALARAGYHVPRLCWGSVEFDENFRTALGAREIEFVFVLTQYPLNMPVDGLRIWDHPRFRATKFFVFLIDTVIYELQPITSEAFKVPGDRFVFGLADSAGQDIFHEFARAQGATTRTMPFPCGAPPDFGGPTTWRERPYEVSFCGNVGMELQGFRPGQSVEENFADYRDGPAPFRRLVEAVDEIHRAPRGSLVTQLMECLSIAPADLLDRRWLMLFWAVDSYMKRRRRIDIVKRFAKSKRKLHLFGNGWEPHVASIPNVIVHGVTSWSTQSEIFGRSKILLNIESNTQCAANDRVFWAAAKGAVLLSQRNPTIDMLFVDGDGYLGYDQTGADIFDVIDRTDGELEAIAASGSLKSRAHHTWDHRIRSAVDHMRTLSAKDESVVVAGIRPEERQLVAHILRLDGQNDHVGVFAYLRTAPYDETDALNVLYILMTTGRFQSAFLVAKVMTGNRNKNPTVDLALAIGGALFDNKDDQALGIANLARWLSHLTAQQRDSFIEQVAVPTFAQATNAKIVGKDRELEAKILKIRALVMPEAKAPHSPPAKGTPKRPHKSRHAGA